MFWRLPLLLLLAHLVAGCQATRFYTQATGGQWEIMTKRRSIDRVLADESVDEQLKSQLRLVRELCAFAERELALPARKQYTSYVDLGRPYVVWNIHAAPEFSFDAKTWWYPVVGRLEYQGYFRKELALDYSQRLRDSGLDVFTGGVDAYSTLGWFNDPVLNTFVFLPEPELADLIFHELAHRKLFFSGDTDFNEAFATAVARTGVRRWFEAKQDDAGLASYLADRKGEDAVVEMILNTRQQLEVFYAQAESNDSTNAGQEKLRLIERLRADYAAFRADRPGFADYSAWMAAPINNAQFNTVDTYYQLVPAFASRLAEADHELPRFFEEMKRLKRLKKEDRVRELTQ